MNKHLRALLIVGGLTVLIVVTFMSYQNKNSGSSVTSQGPQARTIQINQELPGFEAKNQNGQEIKLSDFKGKIVIVNFWASWCGPCVEEVPSLISLLKSFPNDVVLVAISGDSNQEDIDSFMKSFPEMKSLPNSHIVWDSEKKLIPQYQVFRLPESFVVGKDLKLVKKISGSIDWHTQDAIAYMKQLAAGSEASTAPEATSATSTE